LLYRPQQIAQISFQPFLIFTHHITAGWRISLSGIGCLPCVLLQPLVIVGQIAVKGSYAAVRD